MPEETTTTANTNGQSLPLLGIVPQKDSISRTVRVDFKGVFFDVRHVTRQELFMLGQRCQTLVYVKGEKARTPKMDFPRFVKELSTRICAGWSGLTPSTIQNLMVVDPESVKNLTPEQLKQEIPFTPEGLETLLQNANGLDDFLQEVSMEASHFRASPVSAEDAEKN